MASLSCALPSCAGWGGFRSACWSSAMDVASCALSRMPEVCMCRWCCAARLPSSCIAVGCFAAAWVLGGLHAAAGSCLAAKEVLACCGSGSLSACGGTAWLGEVRACSALGGSTGGAGAKEAAGAAARLVDGCWLSAVRGCTEAWACSLPTIPSALDDWVAGPSAPSGCALPAAALWTSALASKGCCMFGDCPL